MLFKYLILGAIIYYIYRFYIASPSLNKAGEKPPIPDNKAKPNKTKEDGEYIDYEEVD